jgi:hypothetical protein
MKRVTSISVLAFVLLSCALTSQATAGEGGTVFQARTIIMEDGTSVDEIVINGPPNAPPGFAHESVSLPEPNQQAGISVLPNVPAFSWSFGCSATSGAMIAGYYDRSGYPNMYAGPTNGGVMPMDNSAWPDWEDSHGDTRHQCPLSATHNGLDGRATDGHVDDYWIYYGQPGPDPWEVHGTEHVHGECAGDFMKTNQWIKPKPPPGFNRDGSTTFYNYTSGAPLYDYQIEVDDLDAYDGGYGLKLFYESRGYTVDTMFNQYIMGYHGNSQGFMYEQYKAEIDAGRPVMIHVEGHTMVGVGYDDTSSDLMYIHDTWNYDTHTMVWGGSYSDMAHMGVTVVQLTPWGHNSIATGDWADGGTWEAGTAPTAGDDAVINAGHTVTVHGSAQCNSLTIHRDGVLEIADGASISVEGNVYNSGTLRQTKNVLAGGTTEFMRITNSAGTLTKYYGVDITPDSSGMGTTVVEIKGNRNAGGCTTVSDDPLVYRCYSIAPDAGQSATIRFWYTEDERHGQTANGLWAWHYDVPPGLWSQAGDMGTYAYSEVGATCTSGDGHACWFEAEDISTYSPFGIGNGPAAPTAIGVKETSAGFDGRWAVVWPWLLALGLAGLAGVGSATRRKR